MTTRAGQRNQRVTLQTKTKVKNDFSETVDDWADGPTVWARVIPQSGSEKLINEQRQNPVDYIVNIRNRDGVTPDMRVKWKGQTLHIESVVPDERGAELNLECVVR